MATKVRWDGDRVECPTCGGVFEFVHETREKCPRCQRFNDALRCPGDEFSQWVRDIATTQIEKALRERDREQ